MNSVVWNILIPLVCKKVQAGDFGLFLTSYRLTSFQYEMSYGEKQVSPEDKPKKTQFVFKPQIVTSLFTFCVLNQSRYEFRLREPLLMVLYTVVTLQKDCAFLKCLIHSLFNP